MPTPTIELYTEEPCPGPACQRCRELTQVTQEVAFSGVRRALNRLLGPFRQTPPVQIRHLACYEAKDPEMCSKALPQLHIDGDPVLVGGHWTEAEVKQAVELAVDRGHTPADRASA